MPQPTPAQLERNLRLVLMHDLKELKWLRDELQRQDAIYGDDYEEVVRKIALLERQLKG
jgi:hypothetical protein